MTMIHSMTENPVKMPFRTCEWCGAPIELKDYVVNHGLCPDCINKERYDEWCRRGY